MFIAIRTEETSSLYSQILPVLPTEMSTREKSFVKIVPKIVQKTVLKNVLFFSRFYFPILMQENES